MLPGIWYDSLKKKTTKKTNDSEHLSAHSSRRDGFIIKYIFILYGCTRAIFYNYIFIIRHTNEVNERDRKREECRHKKPWLLQFMQSMLQAWYDLRII